MPINLLKQVQENLHFPALKKIDPTTQDITDSKDSNVSDFSQTALPAVLTGLYKYSATDEGANEILKADYETNWVSKIFDENTTRIIDNIATGAGSTRLASYEQMNNIADEAVKITIENLPENAVPKDVKLFLSNQVNNILPYLPASLHVGDLLDDSTLDDNTNKMAGPVSSLMHSIGSVFSTPESENDTK